MIFQGKYVGEGLKGKISAVVKLNFTMAYKDYNSFISSCK